MEAERNKHPSLVREEIRVREDGREVPFYTHRCDILVKPPPTEDIIHKLLSSRAWLVLVSCRYLEGLQEGQHRTYY